MPERGHDYGNNLGPATPTAHGWELAEAKAADTSCWDFMG